MNAVPARLSAHESEIAVNGPIIGILRLDCDAPCTRGSVSLASTFAAPVKFRTVEGLTVDEVFSPDAAAYTGRVIEAARDLIAQGAHIITSNCGFTARYQQDVQAAVDVPVLLSSLLLVPFLQRMVPTRQKLGVLTANSRSITTDFLAASHLDWDTNRVVISGLEGSSPAFNDAYITCVSLPDYEAIQQEVVAAACDLVATDPSIGCLLLECSEFPPYAAAIQEATGLPVFDFTSLIEFFSTGLRRTTF